MKTNITDEEQVKFLCELATKYAGIEEGQIFSKSRRLELQLQRSIVGVIAREFGIHHNSIANVLNRDRCSVYHYEKKHAENYAYWNEYRELFNKVYNSYSDIRKHKHTFETKEELKNYLLHNGVKHNTIDGKVSIVVSSGKVKSIIKTNYKEFSSTLKKITECLVNHNHNIDVNI